MSAGSSGGEGRSTPSIQQVVEMEREFEIVRQGLLLIHLKKERGERITEEDARWITRYDILRAALNGI